MSMEVEMYPGKFMVILFTLDDHEAVIEPLTPKNLDAAYLLFQQGVREGLLLDRSYDQFCQLQDNLVVCVFDESKVVGIAGLVPYSENHAEVVCFYVHEDFRNKKIASRLVDVLAEEAEVNNWYEFIFACTTSADTKKFFELHGFVVVSSDQIPQEKWDDYSSGRSPWVLIKKPRLGF